MKRPFERVRACHSIALVLTITSCGRLASDAHITGTDAGLAQDATNECAFDIHGSPATLASNLATPAGIAVRGSNLYWVNSALDTPGAGSVETAPISGGCSTIIASHQNQPQAIAVDDTNVYWGVEGLKDANGNPTSDGTIMKIPQGGGSAVVLASVASPGGLVVKQGTVYFTDEEADGAIMAVPAAGGSVVTLAHADCPLSIAVDATNIYWSDLGLCGVSQSSGAVMKMPFASDGPVVVAQASHPISIAVDDAFVYWTEDQGVMKTPILGGPITTLAVASAPHAESGIAVDATNVYWVDFLAGTVSTVPKAGVKVSVLSTTAIAPEYLAVDDTNIYWSNGCAQNLVCGSVMMLPK